MRQLSLKAVLCCCLLFSCSEEESSLTTTDPRLIIRLNFDPNQQRLDNLGRPAIIPDGNAAQTPLVREMSAHYIEFAPSAFTQLGEGGVIYQGKETNEGGTPAIDFQEAFLAGDGEVLINRPLSSLSPGSYQWVRVSLTYQEGDIQVLINGNELSGTLASFVGFNTYITDFNLNEQTIEVNGNRLQGFWAFEAMGFTEKGQAPEGATTVPNPLFQSSPIPEGSCVLTGKFAQPFVVTGNETEDITVSLSFSTNNSFEWTDINEDGKYEPGIGEQLVDMGLRGLIPAVS
ncbi:MAG: hypothetical protein AAGH46_07630, partial [Bacteroidota bacterium]